MTGLADRLEQVIERREISERGLSKRAGLHPSHVGGIVRGPPEKEGGVSLGSLQQLARAADVRLAWLAANEGSMLEPGAPDPGRFSTRVAEMLRERGMEPSALDAAIGKKPGFTTRSWLKAKMKGYPHDEDVVRAARALRCSFDWLRYGIGQRTDAPPTADATGTEHALKLSVEQPGRSETIRALERQIKPQAPKKRSALDKAKRRWKKP